MLAAYILMALILAGLNFGYAEQAPAEVAAMINRVWHFYENWVKTIFIAIGGYLTLRITGLDHKPSLRRKNLRGFLAVALVVHIAGPYIFRNPDLYYFAMPLPWTNLPLQLLVPESAFYKNFLSLHGVGGITATLLFYLLVTLVVYGGTVIKGRRWQCSTLCLFNGFASEVFDPVFPLAGKAKKTGPGLLKASYCIVTCSARLKPINTLFSSCWRPCSSGSFLPGGATATTALSAPWPACLAGLQASASLPIPASVSIAASATRPAPCP